MHLIMDKKSTNMVSVIVNIKEYISEHYFEDINLNDMSQKFSINWGELDAEVVGIFANGAEALAGIDKLKPHIIITDIAMPVMNGIEMSQIIKKTYPYIKIIFISCHSDFEFAKSAIDLGIYGYVLKPVIYDELKIAVKELLEEFRIQDLQLKEKEKMMKQLEEMLPMVQEQFRFMGLYILTGLYKIKPYL